MKEYHKIPTVFKRDPATKFKTLLDEFAIPEFEYLKDCNWVFTEKIDGTCIRVMWKNKKVFFGGKTDNAQIPTFLLSKLQELFPVDKMEKHFPDTDVCLYGEGYGNKIQKVGKDYMPHGGVNFILFDVKIGDWWLNGVDVSDVANKLEIKVVPFLGIGTLQQAIDKVKGGFLSNIGLANAEGLVLRPMVVLCTRNGKRIIAKIKTKDFKEGCPKKEKLC